MPPFNRAKGEGTLISDKLIVSYPTKTASSTEPGLGALYGQAVCAGLTPAQCATNQASLDSPEFGNFNLNKDPIGNNPLGIKLIDALKIDYTAIKVDQSAVTVSGGIVIPEVAPSSIKGLILYYHATTVQRSNVPSNLVTPDNPGGDQEGIPLAALWASAGYVVVMPDYIGLGDDTTHRHPYVAYPRENAQSGLAMLLAARSVLSSEYHITGQLPLRYMRPAIQMVGPTRWRRPI